MSLTPDHVALAAGGSLAIPDRIHARPRRLGVELCGLFVVVPLAMAYAIHDWHLSLILLLQPVLLGLIGFLLWDKTFSVKREFSMGLSKAQLLSIMVVFAIVSAAAALFEWRFQPEQFLSFPRTRPIFWAIVMVFYPLFSALPQELAYRTFFFHRYGALFGARALAAVLTCGALFGFAHIIIGSWVSIVLSAGFGVLVAYRYSKHRSLLGAWLEHSLYGNMIFTVGLGRYFFTGHALLAHGVH